MQGDGKAEEHAWLPATIVRKALTAHFAQHTVPTGLGGGVAAGQPRQSWENPYGRCTLHVRNIPPECEGDEALAAIFQPYGTYIQGTVRQRSNTVVDGEEVVALSWALVRPTATANPLPLLSLWPLWPRFASA